MAQEKKFVEAITSQEVDFAQWYTDVVKKAELIDYTSMKGMMVYRPNGYAIWEKIQQKLDAKFKEAGVQNVYMPMLIPESLLQKEKDHVEGFAPEVAWVTQGGGEPLQEKVCIRPTSETLFCEHWSKTIQSYRDLPKVYNQWCSVLRWEKTTRPFLRSKEFLWQEGHTMHATGEEAHERTLLQHKIYEDFIRNELAIPCLVGRKTEKEKFAGAEATYTIEAMMKDGQALQSATSHYFGDGFARAFDVSFLDENNEIKYGYETSWGLSTRIIGAIIMVHGDDSGLVLPPHIAPVQVRVIPIAQHKPGVLEKAREVLAAIRAAGFTADIDENDKMPGWKYSEQEMVGIPVRVEIGPKDIEKGQAVVVRRDNREKYFIPLEEVPEQLDDILEMMQTDMYDRAEQNLKNHISSATALEEMKERLDSNPGFIKAMWCGERECEEAIKEKIGASTRCIPEDQEQISDVCICCGKPAKHMVYFGKAY